MTFADRLREILSGECHVHIVAHDSIYQLEYLLVDRAAEIEALVRAADIMLRYPNLREYVGTQTFDPLREALAALEKE
jgi:hypothetical protein